MYCLSGRQPYSTLKLADEVKVAYADRDRIKDFVVKLENKRIILDLPDKEMPNMDLLKQYKEVFPHFCVALHRLDRIQEFKENKIKWYWPFPITTYYELQQIAALGPCYLVIGTPLVFDLAQVVKRIDKIPLRAVINMAQPEYLPNNEKENHLTGFYVRPEDIEAYSRYIQYFEFDNCSLDQERSLLKVYQSRRWPGNLNLLINRLNIDVDNRIFPDEFAENRMNCKQRCMRDGACHYCTSIYTTYKLLRQKREKEYEPFKH